MSDGADKAHQKKEDETGSGNRLVPHATFDDADRELRQVSDEAEVERVKAFEETGYVAAPGVGDYHANRRAAKLAAGAGVEVEQPSSLTIDQAKAGAAEARKGAAAARGDGSARSAQPSGRRSAPTSTTAGPSGSGHDNTGGDAGGRSGDSGESGGGSATKPASQSSASGSKPAGASSAGAKK
jgi:hypothetical protein